MGNSVKLPGPTADCPNRYPFETTTYQMIYDDLVAKDPVFYKENGLLDIIARNIKVKAGPQRWQDRPAESRPFDCVITFERRVMELVVADMRKKEAEIGGCNPCLVVNLEVKDSLTEATTAAPDALKLCRWLEEADDWESEVEAILQKFAEETGRDEPQYEWCFA